MRCIFCANNKTEVVDSRMTEDGSIRRRRSCINCNNRFTSFETAELELSVLKKDGRKEAFNLNKIKRGLVIASQKRIPEANLDVISEKVERRVRRMNKSVIKTSVIGRLIMKELLKKDKIAYLRFASVYKAFDNLQLFEKELEALRDI